MIASQNGPFETVTTLGNSNADVNLHLEDGWSAIMLASQNGHSQIVATLINSNADVNMQKKDG